MKDFKINEDYEITEISANIGFTINLGDYESARIDQGMKVRLLKDMDEEQVENLKKKLNKTLRDRVGKEIKKIYKMEIIRKEDL